MKFKGDERDKNEEKKRNVVGDALEEKRSTCATLTRRTHQDASKDTKDNYFWRLEDTAHVAYIMWVLPRPCMCPLHSIFLLPTSFNLAHSFILNFKLSLGFNLT